MPGWLTNLGSKATANLAIVESAESMVSQVTDAVDISTSNLNLGPTLTKLQSAGRECQQSAQECIDICKTTTEKRNQMIDFGNKIQSSFRLLKEDGSDSAAALELIKDLTNGDKVREARDLAQGLDGAAIGCVEASIKMIDAMERGVDDLPDVIENAIEKAASKADDDEDSNVDFNELVQGIDRDIDDVHTCVEEIQKLNLATAIKIGMNAFTQLRDKAIRSRSMFDSIQGFATDVLETTQAFNDMNISDVVLKSKAMLKCISLTKSMRTLAECSGKLMKSIVQLFEAVAERISELWSALAFAKDCMLDSLKYVEEAKSICIDAKAKSLALIERSKSVKVKLEDIGDLNAKSITAVQDLTKDGGGEIKDAIELAQSMDDLVVSCSEKVVHMVSRVNEGFEQMPDILTHGIDIKETGKEIGDPSPPNVEEDVTELESCTRAIEDANLIDATKAGVNGFTGVSNKAVVCRDMLDNVDGFSGSCLTTVDAFINVWDLESATTKIQEMCRLVNLGEMMEQFAQQIKSLVLAVIQLMNASIIKYSSSTMSISDIIGEDLMDSAMMDVGQELVGDAMDMMFKNKMSFFGT